MSAQTSRAQSDPAGHTLLIVSWSGHSNPCSTDGTSELKRLPYVGWSRIETLFSVGEGASVMYLSRSPLTVGSH